MHCPRHGQSLLLCLLVAALGVPAAPVQAATAAHAPTLICYPLNNVPEYDRMARFVRKWVIDIANSIHFDPNIEICSADGGHVFATLEGDQFRLGYNRALIQPMMSSPRTHQGSCRMQCVACRSGQSMVICPKRRRHETVGRS
jgi:hypothetical protein